LRKLKIYLDTSVINFYYAVDAPEAMEITIVPREVLNDVD
jgi:hypothetical protein